MTAKTKNASAYALAAVAPAATCRAAIYARISRDQADAGLGVERQLEDLRHYCEREGWEAVPFVDNDTSASTYSRRRRPQFAAMLRAVRAGDVDVVLVLELSRFTRDPAVIEGLIRAQKRGVRLVSVQGGEYDPNSGTGKLRLRTEAMVAASYADFVSDKVRRKKLELVDGGQGPGGSRAFGYLGADPKKGRRAGTVINQREANAYRKAVEDVLAGSSLASIARRWNAAGFRTPRTGSLWGVPSVRVTLLNPRHAGLLARARFEDVERGPDHWTKRKTGYDIIGEGDWPPIISRADHERLTRLLDGPDRQRREPARRGMLTSMMTCGACGGIMRAGGHNVYQCGTSPELPTCGKVRIRKDALDAIIEAAVLEVLNDSRKMAKALAAPKRQRTRKGDDAEKLQAELDELADLTGRGELPMREYLRVRKPLEERLARARAQAVDSEDRPSSAAKALADAPDIRKAWRRLDVDQKRRVLMVLIDGITIAPNPTRGAPFDPDRIAIKWRA